MKRFIALLFIFAATAHAHVLLTTPYSVTAVGGVTACAASHLTMTGSSWTWGTNGGPNLMSITYSFGTATFSGGVDTNFVIAACAPTITNVLNMTTGQWVMMLNGVGVMVTGTLTGGQLTGALSAFTGPGIALRDFADFFLTQSGAGFLPTALGTQPDLWQLGDQ